MSDDLRYLLLPQKKLPPQKKALALFAIRTMWHGIYDFTPLLDARLGSLKSRALDEYLEYSFSHHIKFDWQRHVHFLMWLKKASGYSTLFDESIEQETLAVTALLWSNDNYAHTGSYRAVIMNKKTGCAMGAIRGRNFTELNKVVMLGTSAQSPEEGEDTIQFGLCDTSHTWSIRDWVII